MHWRTPEALMSALTFVILVVVCGLVGSDALSYQRSRR
jgi:hypothetical protein